MGNGSRFPCRYRCVDRQGGRGSKRAVGFWLSRCNGVAWLWGNTELEVRPDAERSTCAAKGSGRWPPRKASDGSACIDRTKTDTGGRGEKPKVIE